MASINDMYGLGGIFGGQSSSQMGQFMNEQDYLRRKMAEEYQSLIQEQHAVKRGAAQSHAKKDDSELLLLLED